MQEPKLVLTIFKSGKMNFLDTKNKDDIYEAFKKIYPLLLHCKIQINITNKNKSDEHKVP